MILMIIFGIVCAILLAFAVHPLMKGGQRRTGFITMIVCALAALGMYTAIGAPDLPAAHAVFETAGPRHEQRIASQRELVLLEALSGAPDHVPLLLELGTVRIQAGHPQDAFEVLNHADTLKPNDPAIHEALGAAHYALALHYAMQPRKDAQRMAKDHFAKAMTITPRSADFFDRLKNDSDEFQRRP